MSAVLLPLAAMVCLGSALVTSRLGLRDVDARSGASTSVPSAAVLFIVVSAFTLDWSGWSWQAVAVFALVGLFFPAAVTLLNFVSTARIGPAMTSAIGGTSPLFSISAALVLLGEPLPGHALVATLGVACGIALMSWQRNAIGALGSPANVLLSVAASAIRGLAMVIAKLGLAWWASPLAATLIGYVVSTLVLVTAHRARASGSAPRRHTARSRGWFIATGLLNGVGLLMAYTALQRAPVALVAPFVSAYPLVTLGLSALVLRNERLGVATVAGALLTVASVIYLVSA